MHARSARAALRMIMSRRVAAAAATGVTMAAMLTFPAPARAIGPVARVDADSAVQLNLKLRQLDDMREDITVPREVAYKLASELAEKYFDNAAVLWRAARTAYDMEQLKTTPKADKQRYINQAQAWIDAAKSLDRSDGAIFRWSGIISNARGQYMSTSDYIKNTFVIRDDWAQAVALNPADANALHLLGRWHFNVAGTPWYQRKIAATLFAEPPTATYQEALELFRRAEDASPGFWKANAWMLAETYNALSLKTEAAEWARKAVNMRVAGQYDFEAHEKSLALLKGLDRPAYDEYMKSHPDGGMITIK